MRSRLAALVKVDVMQSMIHAPHVHRGFWVGAAALLGLCVSLVAPADARQTPQVSPIGEVAQVAQVLGAVHYLQITCASADNQLWRGRMVRLLELEAPQAGSRRERLVRAFNDGFTAEEQRSAGCGSVADNRRRLSAEGRRLAEALRSLYVN